MHERFVDIATPDSAMDTFVTHPETGGPFPVVVIFMDIWGLREELFDVARRIATVGYYCLVPNFYHRHGKVRFEFRDGSGRMISPRPEHSALGASKEASTKNGTSLPKPAANAERRSAGRPAFQSRFKPTSVRAASSKVWPSRNRHEPATTSSVKSGA